MNVCAPTAGRWCTSHHRLKATVILACIFVQWALFDKATAEENVVQFSVSICDDDKSNKTATIEDECTENAQQKLVGRAVIVIESDDAKEKVEKPLDTLVGYLIPVVAAFLSALLTFVATQYTDEKNWSRAKRDAMADRQFSTMAAAARNIGTATTGVHQVRAKLSELLVRMAQGSVARQAATLELQSARISWLATLREALSLLSVVKIELKLVDCNTGVISGADSLISTIGSLKQFIEELKPDTNESYLEKLEDCVAEIDQASERFVVEAQNEYTRVYGK